MIKVDEFCNELSKYSINFYTGVPDSLLKELNNYLSSKNMNIIAANEGSAIALAVGDYLATGNIPVAYMQNSGLGNAVNPITSLVAEEVYSIPMLLMVGWRGMPGIKDEPQHKFMGEITLGLLNILKIPYVILTTNTTSDDMKKYIKDAYEYMNKNKSPYAFVVEQNCYEEYNYKKDIEISNYTLSRENAIDIIISNCEKKSIFISTTGKTSRELFELREKKKQCHSKDLLMVGSMGHASQVAIAIATEKKEKTVYCLDGDGAALMHLGGMTIINSLKVNNFRHIVLNNGCHESVGGQKTVGYEISFCDIAKACNYSKVIKVDTEESLINVLKNINDYEGSIFIEVMIKSGSRKDLGRPTISPIENKYMFMKEIEE